MDCSDLSWQLRWKLQRPQVAVLITKKGWRRRPDLNRGWRFCRLSRNGYVVDSSCFLVSARPSFYPVFGQFWTHIGPKFANRFFVGLEPKSQGPVVSGPCLG